jgi:nucleoside 2-deoxyribosyltransferase
MDKLIEGGECPLTGWKISEPTRKDFAWRYFVTCKNYTYNIWVSMSCFENKFVLEQKHIIRWLLLSGRLPTIRSAEELLKESNLLTEKKILDIIAESFVPQTPKEKSEQILILLNKVFPIFKGEMVKSDLFNLSFFKEIEEMKIYLDFLVDSNYITKDDISKVLKISDVQSRNVDFYLFAFKFKGIQFLASLEENGRNSKNCFIVMSFSEKPKIKAIKEAIIDALVETKYNVVIINEKYFESDRTINDAIIAEIKRAKFVIADFTEQKAGVYFEAGFALGLGIPVIYCCDKTNFKKSHFDINHYPHILYNSPEELSKGLVDKIRAWID